MWKQVLLLFCSISFNFNFGLGHQINPFQPYHFYLKSNENVNSVLHKDANYRLGDETKPSFYDIKLKFDLNNPDKFQGNVDITFESLTNMVETFEINGENIQINENGIKIMGKGEQIDYFKRFTFNDTYQKFIISTNSPLLVKKEYVLQIQYQGQITDDLLGVYKSTYKEGNDTKILIATHFGQFARRLMPCWDEPRFKAQFQFTIERGMNFKAFSNAAKLRSDENTDYFKATSPISTYILALVISEMKLSENIEKKFAVLARPDAINQTAYALTIGPELIKAFDEWTEMEYFSFSNVEKMELGAIPDFIAGAMENWGFILHQELYSLYDENHANTAQKQLIPTVISHELAHMWFGDLVTCDWFDETYLNEGFARYFQFIGLDRVEKFDGLMQFVVTSTQRAMQADATLNSYPLSNKDSLSLPQIRKMFGPISYDKGGSILRMAHQLMRDQKFTAAIRSYLKKRQFKTAVTEDLLTELENHHPAITEILGPYIHQAGYPIVSVSREGDILTLDQTRFLLNTNQHNDTSRWTIPITIATQFEDFEIPTSNLILFKAYSESPFKINISEIKSSYYVMNIQEIGFYRVNYDMANWKAIELKLKSTVFEELHVLNRAQIVDDLLNLARSGYVTYDFAFNIIRYIKRETHYLPWLSFFNGISYLRQRIVDTPLKTQFDSFMNELMADVTDFIGFEESGDEFLRLNRIQILDWACTYGNQKDCVEKALEHFDKVIQGENIYSDLKPAVYCTGLRETQGNWEKMWNRYIESNYATEQEMILKALGCSRNATEINLFLDKTLTNEIRLQYKPNAYISAVSGNLENVDVVLDYLIKNTIQWGEIMDVVWTFGDLSARFTNEEQFLKLEKHVNTLQDEWKIPLLEIMKENRKLMEWDQARLPELNKFFNAAVKSTVSFGIILLMTIRYAFF